MEFKSKTLEYELSLRKDEHKHITQSIDGLAKWCFQHKNELTELINTKESSLLGLCNKHLKICKFNNIIKNLHIEIRNQIKHREKTKHEIARMICADFLRRNPNYMRNKKCNHDVLQILCTDFLERKNKYHSI
jgi:hypothetical protein